MKYHNSFRPNYSPIRGLPSSTAVGIAHCWSHQTIPLFPWELTELMRQLELQLLEIWILLTHYKTLLLQPISSLSSPGTQQVCSVSTRSFMPIARLCLTIKTYLQLTSEDLSFLKTITASCKICQTSNHTFGHLILPFLTHQARDSSLGQTGSSISHTYPQLDLSDTF